MAGVDGDLDAGVGGGSLVAHLLLAVHRSEDVPPYDLLCSSSACAKLAIILQLLEEVQIELPNDRASYPRVPEKYP